MATDSERELAFAPHSSRNLNGIFLLFKELFPGGWHAAASVAQQAQLWKTLCTPLFSITVIPPDVELINMNKCTCMIPLHSFPVLYTPFCYFCQLSVHQLTNPNNFLVLLHKGFQTLDAECKRLSILEILISRERTHFTTLAMLFLMHHQQHIFSFYYTLRFS